MLSLYDNRQLGRREFLRIGGLGLGGLSLADLLAVKASAAGGSVLRDKSVIFLFMHGGPSQTETFDPKMTAPSGIRSATGEVQTSLPGVTFGGTFREAGPVCGPHGGGAGLMSPATALTTSSPSSASTRRMPTWARCIPASWGKTGPAAACPPTWRLFPQAVNPQAHARRQTSSGSSIPPAAVGGALLAVCPRQRRHVSRKHEARTSRCPAWTTADCCWPSWIAFDRTPTPAARGRPGQHPPAGLRHHPRRRGRSVRSDRRKTPKPSPATIPPLWSAPSTSTRSGTTTNATRTTSSTLGKLLLLARRLCEAGCGFVTVTTNFVWDMHADHNNATMEEGMRYMGQPFDHAVSAFLEDVEQRGLSEKILLVCSGEMGRTPKINARGGRDHWGNLAPLLLAGGGLNMGQVIGQSTRDAGEPLSTPSRIPDLIATIMHTLFDLGELRLVRGVPNDIARAITSGEPIPGLV